MELPRPPRRACQRGLCSRGPASPIARADAVTARPRPGSSSPATPSTCPSLGRAGACLGHELADSRGQQRYRAGSRDLALTSGEGSEQRRAQGIPSMACKGSGVQIPSAPPQVSGPLRRRPPANRGARAADRQQLTATPTSPQPPHTSPVPAHRSWQSIMSHQGPQLAGCPSRRPRRN